MGRRIQLQEIKNNEDSYSLVKTEVQIPKWSFNELASLALKEGLSMSALIRDLCNQKAKDIKNSKGDKNV